MFFTASLKSSSRRAAEQGLSTTASARPNTHACISLHVGEARKIAWSLGERILREGVRYPQLSTSPSFEEDSSVGGGGRAGVSGTGVGFAEGGCLRFRGSSLGIRSLRLGIEETAGECPARACGCCWEAIRWYAEVYAKVY